MPISFQCPECAKSFNVRDELAGKKARCKCGAAIQVPQPAAPVQQQPIDPLLDPLSVNQPAADPLMGSVPPAQPPVDPLIGPQAVDPLAGPVSLATPFTAPAGGGANGMHIGVKVGAGVGGVAMLGLLVWLGISLLGGDSETGPAGDAETVAGTDAETGTGDGTGQETTPAEPQASAGQAAQPPVEQPQQPAADDASLKTMVLYDSSKDHAFSFKSGSTLTLVSRDQLKTMDLVFDHGVLFSNNSVLGDEYPGSGGISDLGMVELEEVIEIPALRYLPSLSNEQIKVGHTYAVRTANGEHYGLIHVDEILSIPVEGSSSGQALKISWRYLVGF